MHLVVLGSLLLASSVLGWDYPDGPVLHLDASVKASMKWDKASGLLTSWKDSGIHGYSFIPMGKYNVTVGKTLMNNNTFLEMAPVDGKSCLPNDCFSGKWGYALQSTDPVPLLAKRDTTSFFVYSQNGPQFSQVLLQTVVSDRPYRMAFQPLFGDGKGPIFESGDFLHHGTVNYTKMGDGQVHLATGIRSDGNLGLWDGQVQVVANTAQQWSISLNDTAYKNLTNIYVGGLSGSLQEVLVYDRVLTNAEVVAVNKHLSAKWFGDKSDKPFDFGTAPPAAPPAPPSLVPVPAGLVSPYSPAAEANGKYGQPCGTPPPPPPPGYAVAAPAATPPAAPAVAAATSPAINTPGAPNTYRSYQESSAAHMKASFGSLVVVLVLCVSFF